MRIYASLFASAVGSALLVSCVGEDSNQATTNSGCTAGSRGNDDAGARDATSGGGGGGSLAGSGGNAARSDGSSETGENAGMGGTSGDAQVDGSDGATGLHDAVTDERSAESTDGENASDGEDASDGSAPSAPSNVAVVAKPGGIVQITWQAPSDSGSAPVTAYAIDSVPPGASTTTAMLTYTTPPLAVGATYTFKVHATNAIGSGPAAVSSAIVAGDVPSAPADVVATAPSGRGTVTWTAANANGYPVTAYTIVASPGSKTLAVSGTTTTVTFNGLANGTMYRFAVTATNALGDGPAVASNAIAAHCTNTSVTLMPVTNETVSIDYGTPVNAPNPSVTAKRDTRCGGICVNHDIYGWIKFDVGGSIPAWGQITMMNLNLNSASPPIGAPVPALVVWYSKDDGWDTSQTLTAADISRTLAVSSPPFPISGSAGWQSIPVNPAARDWSGDIVDGYITLGIQNTNNVSASINSITYNGFDSLDPTTRPSLDLHVCQ